MAKRFFSLCLKNSYKKVENLKERKLQLPDQKFLLTEGGEGFLKRNEFSSKEFKRTSGSANQKLLQKQNFKFPSFKNRRVCHFKRKMGFFATFHVCMGGKSPLMSNFGVGIFQKSCQKLHSWPPPPTHVYFSLPPPDILKFGE